MSKKALHIRGFTLVEVLVGAAVFVIVSGAAYGAYASLFRFVNLAQYREMAVNLAEERMEILRNMPYNDVGVQGSIPNGNVPYQQVLVRGGISFMVTTIIRNIDLPFDGTAGGTPNDTSPADNKLVSMTISCPTCGNTEDFTVTGYVAPPSLESSGNTGSLFVHVYDSTGEPIQDADVTVVNDKATSTITINDVTNGAGTLTLVGVPPGVNAYHVSVTKPGYSIDRTYYPVPANPNPNNPDATVLTGQVSEVNLFIDRLTDLSITSVTPTCTLVPDYDFTLTGSKEIGAGLPKFTQNITTGASGVVDLNNLEWDTGYTISQRDVSHDLYGVNPSNPVTLNPGATVNMQLTVVPNDPRSLMIRVTDGSSDLAISGVSVRLRSTALSYDKTLATGRGYINQSDWSGGSGQAIYSNATRYDSDDSNIDVTTVPGDIRLRNNAFGEYNLSGFLDSSTFDTGTSSYFYGFVWEPVSQVASTSVKFQFATATSTTPTAWNFTGPDGTSGSYYEVSDSSLDNSLSGKRYARYRVYVDSATSSATSNISDVGFSYASDCIPPGQVIFQHLTAGDYTLTISKAGYATISETVNISNNWEERGYSLNQ